MRRSAFTAIEMLIVVAIIGILAGLLLPGVTMMRNRAKVVATTVKVQAVTTGLQQAGAERDLVALLVDRLAGFDTPSGATLNAPPGQRYRISGGGGTADWARDSIALTQFRPDFTVALLHYAGVMETVPVWGPSSSEKTADTALRAAAVTAYDTDRTPKRPWNDAFGSPIVIAYAYWDTRSNADATKSARPRGISVAVGSPGSRPAATGTMSSQLGVLWTQITDGCDKNGEWKVDSSTNAWDAPPWQGIKNGKHKATGSTCVLSAPVEIP